MNFFAWLQARRQSRVNKRFAEANRLNTSGQAHLEGQNIVVHFNGQLLFSIESLCFAQQDTILLQGENGAGKTTLMKLLAGLAKPSLGQITPHGFPFGGRALVAKATYLHQTPYVYSGTVLDNLKMAMPLLSRYQSRYSATLKHIINMAGLNHLLDTPATYLSGGEKQRLALARVCLIQPKLLLLDEPTANMDRESIALMVNMIRQLQQQQTGLMIVSHQHNDLAALCQQHWLLTNKRLTVCRKPEEVSNNNSPKPYSSNLVGKIHD
ncbi:ATP-binding cassette domain-containing protein [Thalassotalea aquiviva]|uniref:ABC transporter ATP-binding protein n=1 Tax=Thalassotalea aquiviva TaxID=3242415 RepID=UPI00352A93D1